MSSLLQALFGQAVTVIGEDGQPETDNGLVERLHEMFNFAQDWQYPPFNCQNCGRTMRGPICPHCGEIQSGYDYAH